ncbi:MAG: hypothetical protein HRU29_13790 [Rhizobiales bacterium]|nr:hypothetical protein [Hyphomicrobiales bacterium]NRB15465.1 hypothetical protein [Hyphomicrobiales bacterium]
MKLLRLGAKGAEIPCILGEDNIARDVSGIVADFTPETITGLVDRLSGVTLSDLPAVAMEGVRVAAPMAQPRNIYCIGLNYSDHAAEAGMAIPDEPILFNLFWWSRTEHIVYNDSQYRKRRNRPACW